MYASFHTGLSKPGDYALYTITIDNTNGMYASFHTGLSKPGDYALYTITIENRGDIDARVEQINTYYQENEYVTFTLSGLNKGEVIGGSETRELLVRVEFNDKITSIEGDIDISLDVSIDVAQDSDNPLPADEYYEVLMWLKIVIIPYQQMNIM